MRVQNLKNLLIGDKILCNGKEIGVIFENSVGIVEEFTKYDLVIVNFRDFGPRPRFRRDNTPINTWSFHPITMVEIEILDDDEEKFEELFI